MHLFLNKLFGSGALHGKVLLSANPCLDLGSSKMIKFILILGQVRLSKG